MSARWKLGPWSAQAEDVVQGVAYAVLKRRSLLAGLDDHGASRLFWRLARDHARGRYLVEAKRSLTVIPESEPLERGRRQKEGVSDLSAPGSVMEAREVFAQLSETDQEVLYLALVERRTSAEIATLLGETESAVQSRAYRARRRLAALLATHPPNVGSRIRR